MKLLSKTSISYLWVSMAILLVTGVLLFFFLKTAVSAEIEEQLELELAMVKQDLQAGKVISFPLAKIDTVSYSMLKKPQVFRDTLIYDYVQKEYEGYYYLQKAVPIHNKTLQITVLTSYIGWDGYVKAILAMFVVMATLFLISGTLVNYRINKTIWTPFLQNLSILKSYSVSSGEQLRLNASDIDEFTALNTVVLDLTGRAKSEYENLQEFTENASHEIQTPLSILKSRLESISQLPMDATLSRFLLDAKQAADRLSRVNRGLLLLVKLENDQFENKTKIRLDELLMTNIALMEDLFEQRKLRINQEISPVMIFASVYLMEIMLINLLSNLRSYASPDSTANIVLDAYSLQFINEGPPLPFAHEKLFTRFGKSSHGGSGTGLGLSIVKQICLNNKWNIDYSYAKGRHIFTVKFRDASDTELTIF